MSSMNPTRLSDRELEAEVTRLAHSEREVTAALIAHLAELYGRRLHERAGYDSLFTYCVRALRLSESAAYDRMKAAKVARRYPMILGLLADGGLNLTTIRLVAPHLTQANHRELLAAVSGKRKRQVPEVLAGWFPQPDVPTSIRKLPTVPPSTVAAPINAFAPGPLCDVLAAVPVPRLPAPAPREPVRPLSPDRYQITFTATGSVREKLELAQDLLRHAIPHGDPAQVIERALDVLVEELVKRKFAVTECPRESRGQAEDSRNIPAEAKRAVYVRDRGCCAYVAPDGHRCGARSFMEFHHVQPHGARGKPTVDNISLRCRAHNQYGAEVFYGPGKQYVPANIVKEQAASYDGVKPHTFSFRNENTELAEDHHDGRAVG